jgi:hypothetical protein
MKGALSISAALIAASLFTNVALADVQVQRRSDENPAVEIARSTIYGGLAGLMVGLAFAALDDDSSHPDLIQNSFAIGTFAGLGIGVYWAFSRPQPSGMIQIDDEGTHLALVPPEIGPDGGPRMRLLSVRF